MKSIYMKNYFTVIYEQREQFANEIKNLKEKEWERPQEDKWSIGETYYHLYLMIKLFRQLNKSFLPIAKPVAKLRSEKPYKLHSEDIFTEYTAKHNKPMKAPFVLMPPKDIKEKISFQWILSELDIETRYLQKILSNISDNVAGHIRYPDPIAHYPNLIQCINILGIHEKHHFLLCKKYYNLD
ncbi:DinB family protein [Lysinibacillus sp. 54212]|uniref:DinB family protein n=1 Tax=Lysinibacillus sp. 54212 TaxID=3119829 RepID=UPI002FC8F8B7